MISFWNITSNKLNTLPLSANEEKIIFVSDTGRVYADYNGIRTEYRNIIYVQDINNVPVSDANKSLIYFDLSTNKLYFYDAINGYKILNPDSDSLTYIGRYTTNQTITDQLLNTYVINMAHRDSKINDLILVNNNQWLKVNNASQGNDWIKISPDFPTLSAATYETSGLIRIQEGCGLIVSGGVLSLNLMDENKLSGQIVTLNTSGMIDDDIYKQFDETLIEWNEI